MRKEPSDTFSCRGVEDLRIEGVVGHHPMRIQIVAPRNGRSHTHTAHKRIYNKTCNARKPYRLREAKKDKKVPPFLFFCYLFLAKKFLAAEVLPGCYGRWQSAPANGGALCIQCEDNVALESEIHFRDYYLLYVREGIRSISRWE